MTNTTDFDTLVAAHDAAKEALHLAKIKSAKTNIEVLMAQGVVISCDDAYENAMKWDYTSQLAKEAGVTHAQMEDAQEYARTADAIIADLKRTAEQGETDQERHDRLWAIVVTVKGTKKNGKPCKHNGTKKERGLMYFNDGYLCCRCGATIKWDYSAPRPGAPTEAAVEAARLYNLFKNEKVA